MTLRLAGFAALALLSSACTYRNQAPAHLPTMVDYSDYAHYNERFGESPARVATSTEPPMRPEGAAGFVQEAQTTKPAGTALGFVGGANPPAAETVSAEAESTDYEEVEATPGTACYDAAVKAGITNGVCTLIVERKFLLVGEKNSDTAL